MVKGRLTGCCLYGQSRVSFPFSKVNPISLLENVFIHEYNGLTCLKRKETRIYECRKKKTLYILSQNIIGIKKQIDR